MTANDQQNTGALGSKKGIGDCGLWIGDFGLEFPKTPAHDLGRALDPTEGPSPEQ